MGSDRPTIFASRGTPIGRGCATWFGNSAPTTPTASTSMRPATTGVYAFVPRAERTSGYSAAWIRTGCATSSARFSSGRGGGRPTPHPCRGAVHDGEMLRHAKLRVEVVSATGCVRIHAGADVFFSLIPQKMTRNATQGRQPIKVRVRKDSFISASLPM